MKINVTTDDEDWLIDITETFYDEDLRVREKTIAIIEVSKSTLEAIGKAVAVVTSVLKSVKRIK